MIYRTTNENKRGVGVAVEELLAYHAHCRHCELATYVREGQRSNGWLALSKVSGNRLPRRVSDPWFWPEISPPPASMWRPTYLVMG
jgi:hypothetical protein